MPYKLSHKKGTSLEPKSKPSSVNMEKLLNRLFFLILPILLGLSLTFSYYNAQKSSENSKRAAEISERLQQQNERLLNINDAQKQSLDTTKKDIKDLKDTLLCIGMFFNYPSRQNLVISSYDPCIVTNTETGETTTLSLSPGQPATAVSPQGSDQAQSGSRSNTSTSSPNTTPSVEPPQSDTSQIQGEVPPTPPESQNVLQRIMGWFRNLF